MQNWCQKILVALVLFFGIIVPHTSQAAAPLIDEGLIYYLHGQYPDLEEQNDRVIRYLAPNFIEAYNFFDASEGELDNLLRKFLIVAIADKSVQLEYEKLLNIDNPQSYTSLLGKTKTRSARAISKTYKMQKDAKKENHYHVQVEYRVTEEDHLAGITVTSRHHAKMAVEYRSEASDISDYAFFRVISFETKEVK